ncbi:MAG: hypothetical protein ACREEM_41350 [Blastocatellia bacterium]
MARTILSLSHDVLREVRGQATYYEARKAVENALNWIDALTNWEFLHKEGLINVEPTYSTGTVAVTAGATAVTGTGTVWSASWSYRAIKFADRQLPYLIASIGSATALTLASPLSGSVNITAGSYQIYQRRYALPTDCEMGRDLFIRGPRMTGTRGDGIIPKKGRLEFDREADPFFQSGPPRIYSDDAYDETNNLPTIAFHPYPTIAGEYFINYYKKLTVPQSPESARIMIPESFEAAVLMLAAAEVKQRMNHQGWLALQQQGRELVRSLFTRFGASPAYENLARADYEELPEMFGASGQLYIR